MLHVSCQLRRLHVLGVAVSGAIREFTITHSCLIMDVLERNSTLSPLLTQWEMVQI